MNANEGKDNYLSPLSREAHAAYLTCDYFGCCPLQRALIMPRHNAKLVARLIWRAERSDYQNVVWC